MPAPDAMPTQKMVWALHFLKISVDFFEKFAYNIKEPYGDIAKW